MASASFELFKEFLDSKGFNYASHIDNDGDGVVDFPYDGKVVKCFFSGDKYLSLYIVFERVPEDKLADVIFLCNDLNSRYKWVTFYVDKDGDVIIHDDAVISVETAADEAFELIIRMLDITKDTKAEIMKCIYA